MFDIYRSSMEVDNHIDILYIDLAWRSITTLIYYMPYYWFLMSGHMMKNILHKLTFSMNIS